MKDVFLFLTCYLCACIILLLSQGSLRSASNSHRPGHRQRQRYRIASLHPSIHPPRRRKGQRLYDCCCDTRTIKVEQFVSKGKRRRRSEEAKEKTREGGREVTTDRWSPSLHPLRFNSNSIRSSSTKTRDGGCRVVSCRCRASSTRATSDCMSSRNQSWTNRASLGPTVVFRLSKLIKDSNRSLSHRSSQVVVWMNWAQLSWALRERGGRGLINGSRDSVSAYWRRRRRRRRRVAPAVALRGIAVTGYRMTGRTDGSELSYRIAFLFFTILNHFFFFFFFSPLFLFLFFSPFVYYPWTVFMMTQTKINAGCLSCCCSPCHLMRSSSSNDVVFVVVVVVFFRINVRTHTVKRPTLCVCDGV